MQRYKVGDQVTVKSLEWYNSQPKDGQGRIDGRHNYFVPKMAEYCGKTFTIAELEIDNVYIIDATDEMPEDIWLEDEWLE